MKKKLNFDLEKYFKKYSYNTNKVVGVNADDFSDLYLLENGILSKATKKDVKQEHLITSYIPNKNVITYELNIQKSLLEKIELDDYIETKCYEEVGLDEAEEYIFKYKQIDNLADEKNIIIEVVIISKTEFNEFFAPVKKDFGYLDFVTYPGYLYNVLYADNILEPQNDLFIYFTKDNIFITLYSEGKFLQTSVIPDGLEELYQQLLEAININNLNFDNFVKLLVQKGLDEDAYTEKEADLYNSLGEIFSNKFLVISNQLHSIIRKFSLTTVDRIYMSTMKGVIPGISDFANMYLGVESNDLKFDTDYNPNNVEIDQLIFLSMLYGQYAYKKENQIDNFTTFYRPPTFFYRKSGQFITISIASLLLSLIYPSYQMVRSSFVESDNMKLEQKLNKLKRINSKLTKINNKLNNKLKKQKETKSRLLNYMNSRTNLIYQIYKFKMDYFPKAKFLAQLTNYLNKYNLYITKPITFGKQNLTLKNLKCISVEDGFTSCKFNNDMMNLIIFDVVAKDNKDITKFINDVVNKLKVTIITPGYSIFSPLNYSSVPNSNLISNKPIQNINFYHINEKQYQKDITKLKNLGYDIFSIKKIYYPDNKEMNLSVKYFDSETILLPKSVKYESKIIIKVKE